MQLGSPRRTEKLDYFLPPPARLSPVMPSLGPRWFDFLPATCDSGTKAYGCMPSFLTSPPARCARARRRQQEDEERPRGEERVEGRTLALNS